MNHTTHRLAWPIYQHLKCKSDVAADGQSFSVKYGAQTDSYQTWPKPYKGKR